LYEGEEVAFTLWAYAKPPHVQIVSRDPAMQRAGNGYLLLSFNGAVELANMLGPVLREWQNAQTQAPRP